MSNPSLQRTLEYDFRSQDENDRKNVRRDRPEGEDVTVTPSQAEGDRDTVERDLGDESDDNFGKQSGGQGERQPTPSQAEGDRKTVERDIRERGGSGQR